MIDAHCGDGNGVSHEPDGLLPGRVRRRLLAVALSGFLQMGSLTRGDAEDRVDYRYEDYQEEGGRIHIQTHGAYFDTTLKSGVSLKGNFIYDAISGATPRGTPYLPGTNAVNTAHMEDTRYAGFLEPEFKLGHHTLSPQASYSQESDYRSIGIALNDAIDFNEKNTTLTLGASHTFDTVLPNPGEYYYRTQDVLTNSLRKDNTDVLLGVTQLLGPATLLSANVTLGYSDGYLSDPYKGVLFNNVFYNPGPDPVNNPYPFQVWPEKRPEHKFRQVAFLSLSHNFEKLDAGGEITYRFSHDDFGITAHTASAQWNQKIGKYVTLSPLIRYETQSAASFYATHFPGDPENQGVYPLPQYYSSDYRLSALWTITYGVSLSVHLSEHASIELGYKRYEIHGTDGVTSPQQYPTANVFGGGLTIWF